MERYTSLEEPALVTEPTVKSAELVVQSGHSVDSETLPDDTKEVAGAKRRSLEETICEMLEDLKQRPEDVRHVGDKILAVMRGPIEYYVNTRLYGERLSVADDVVQETLIGIWKAWKDGRLIDVLDASLPKQRPNQVWPPSESNVLSFLFGIAKYKVTDALREKGRSRMDLVDSEGFAALREDWTQTTYMTPEERIEQLGARDALRYALDSLSERQQKILFLREVYGLSASDAAEALGVSSGDTLRVAQYRALEKLRRVMKEQGLGTE